MPDNQTTASSTPDHPRRHDVTQLVAEQHHLRCPGANDKVDGLETVGRGDLPLELRRAVRSLQARLLTEVAADPGDWAERRRRGCWAANLLVKAGVPIYRAGSFLIPRWVDGRYRTMSPFFRSRLIPEFAQRDRHRWTRQLQAHAARIGLPNLRFVIFTMPSVPVEELPDAITAIGTALSVRINADPLLQDLRVQIHFRATEFNLARCQGGGSTVLTAPAARELVCSPAVGDQLCANVHCNAVVYCPRNQAVWVRAYRRMEALWGYLILDQGPLRSVEAVGKYAHKPPPLPHDLSPAEARVIHEATHGRRMVVWMRAAASPHPEGKRKKSSGA